jgi:transposase-like protein
LVIVVLSDNYLRSPYCMTELYSIYQNAGQWVYLYRAVDKQGRTVDFLLSKRRDMAAAKRFFSRATKQHGAPRVITLDGYAASHRAVATLKTSGILPRRVRVRSCKYLNNVVEQDHRRIKQRIGADARIQAIRDGGRDDPRHSSWQRKSRNNSSTSNHSPEKQPPLRKFGPRSWPLKICKASRPIKTYT